MHWKTLSHRSPLAAREAGKFPSGADMSSVSTLSLWTKEGTKFVGPSSNLAQMVFFFLSFEVNIYFHVILYHTKNSK